MSYSRELQFTPRFFFLPLAKNHQITGRSRVLDSAGQISLILVPFLRGPVYAYWARLETSAGSCNPACLCQGWILLLRSHAGENSGED
jgi:hypothetical protein